METSEKILTELKEIAPFLGRTGLSRVPYAVPPGYFEEFAEILMNRLQLGDSEISPMEEISGISPLLAGLQQKNPYQLPAGYFESGKIKIPSSESSPLKRVAINPDSSRQDILHYQQGSITSHAKQVSIFSRVVRYAVAACLVGLLGITIYNLKNRSTPDPLHSLTTISDQEMANYLDADDIHWTPGLAPETASVEFTESDIRALFSNVSDEELVQYLPVTPSEKGTVN
jgi:hypothetical protein